MSLIIENSNRHEHNGNGIAIDQIVSSCVNIFVHLSWCDAILIRKKAGRLRMPLATKNK